METRILGISAGGLPILLHRFDPGFGPELLVLGGVHGNESEGVVAAQALLGRLIAGEVSYPARLSVIPVFNPDGVFLLNRLNAHGVDLNRNLPTRDWNPQAFNERYPPGPHANSEPENQSLVKWLDEVKPQFVLSLHSWKPMLNVNGACREEAEVASRMTGYEIVDSIGYPTPGSLGTYAGIERDMPTLTYEIERGQNHLDVVKIQVPAIEALLSVAAKRRLP
jgi:protein MpaA